MLRAIFHPLTLLLVAMPIQWVSLGQIGPFSLRVVYLALLVLALSAVLDPRILRASLALAWQNAFWTAPYVLYLLILAVALYGSPLETMAPRQLLYVAGALAIGAILAVRADALRMLRLGSALGLCALVVFVEINAREFGLSWTTAIAHFFTTGDLDFVVFDFFRAVFNAGDPDGDITYVAAEKNGVAVCIFVLALLFRCGHTRQSRDWAGFVFMGITLVLIVLLNTRSVLLVAAVCLAGTFFLGGLRRQNGSMSGRIITITAALTVVAMLPILASIDHPVAEVLSRRMAFADDSTQGRIVQYEDALGQIDGSVLVGSGYYQSSGKTIHNIFLSSWVHAGLVALSLVVVFYIAILARWLGFVWAVVQRPERWHLPARFEWIAVLPVMAVARAWLSGDAGHPFFGEWVALGAFFGFLTRNAMMSAAASRSATGRAVLVYRLPG